MEITTKEELSEHLKKAVIFRAVGNLHAKDKEPCFPTDDREYVLHFQTREDAELFARGYVEIFKPAIKPALAFTIRPATNLGFMVRYGGDNFRYYHNMTPLISEEHTTVDSFQELTQKKKELGWPSSGRTL